MFAEERLGRWWRSKESGTPKLLDLTSKHSRLLRIGAGGMRGFIIGLLGLGSFLVAAPAEASCGSIRNHDLRSYCKSQCGSIRNQDLRHFCKGNYGSIRNHDLRHYGKSSCGSIRHRDLRYYCKASYGSIQNRELRYFGKGQCGSIRNPDLRYLCKNGRRYPNTNIDH